MVGAYNVQPTLGVSDLEVATGFYGGILGLKVVQEDQVRQEVVYESGDCQLLIYVTDHAGTNEATYATWEVDDIGAEVSALQTHGVTFEHYDFPDVTMAGDVHVFKGGTEKAAWFTDPDGNILCLHQLS